jgi:hypothetical protein
LYDHETEAKPEFKGMDESEKPRVLELGTNPEIQTQ